MDEGDGGRSKGADSGGDPLRILVVDDEAALARVLVRLLEPHEAITAATGDEAIERIDADGPFDVVLLDLKLGQERGLDVHARLPDGLKSRVAFMTGGISDPRTRAEVDAVGSPVILKPFTRDGLREAIARLAR